MVVSGSGMVVVVGWVPSEDEQADAVTRASTPIHAAGRRMHLTGTPSRQSIDDPSEWLPLVLAESLCKPVRSGSNDSDDVQHLRRHWGGARPS